MMLRLHSPSDPASSRWPGQPTKPSLPTGPPTCAVVVPTFNERETLPHLLAQLMEISGVSVLVVDDGSPDGTGALAEEIASTYPGRIAVMHRPGKRGLGTAYIEGFFQLLNGKAELIAQMDADLSHDVRYLPAMIAAASAGADLVIGSRYVSGGGVSNWPLRRRLLSRFANLYVRFVTGLKVNDATAGYRCWRREALERMPLARLKSNGYSFQVEMVWEAVEHGLRIAEVPIVFVERAQGRSKLTGSVVVESALLPWRLRRAKAASRR